MKTTYLVPGHRRTRHDRKCEAIRALTAVRTQVLVRQQHGLPDDPVLQEQYRIAREEAYSLGIGNPPHLQPKPKPKRTPKPARRVRPKQHASDLCRLDATMRQIKTDLHKSSVRSRQSKMPESARRAIERADARLGITHERPVESIYDRLANEVF